MTVKEHLTQISNVLVIGCGGAGLRSAIEIKKVDVTANFMSPQEDEVAVDEPQEVEVPADETT